MADPTTDFLGSGPAYPLRAGTRGLPDIDLAVGVPAVRGAVALLLRTAPGELPWDPALGIEPEIFRFDQADARSKNEAHDAINASLGDGEPRLASPNARITVEPRNRKMDIQVDFTPITRNVRRNRVVLPSRSHRDALTAFSTTPLAIQGFMDGISLGLGLGPTGGE